MSEKRQKRHSLALKCACLRWRPLDCCESGGTLILPSIFLLKGDGHMWPWSKKTARGSDEQIINSEQARNFTPQVPEPAIVHDDIRNAIISLRGEGFHFGMSYAQMNGYDEKLTNSERFSELVSLVCSEPKFTDPGIEFAVKFQIEELDFNAKRPEGLTYTVPGVQSATISRLQQEEDSKRWARELLAGVRRLGGNDLRVGFERLGFDFREFLVNTVIERRSDDLRLVCQEVDQRKDVLRPLFLRAYSRGRNKYGETEFGPLVAEINDFFKNFFPEGRLKFFCLAPPVINVMSIALSWVEEARSKEAQPEDGIDFEHWCARKLEQQGWAVVVSNASSDQGVDVIASRDSISVAVQCKRYSTPIGNKAVQEAFAGAKYYNADLAVVIGTGGFTNSAQELAASTSVILLDAEMIGDFSKQVLNRA